jgi:propanol-preferring alcohol dehydrogenase
MVGNEQQMEELLRYAAAGVIRPTIKVEKFSELPQIFEKLKHNQVTGRIVVRIPQ